MKIKILFAISLTLALFTAGYAQTLDKAKLDQFFDRLAEKNKAMGSLVIAKDGKVLYSRTIGFGEINGAEKRPLTAASRFKIGSITKMFTAVIIYQLAEEKKLSLSDTLDKFAPQIPNASRITIAQILGHRSGIHDVLVEPAQQALQAAAPISKEDLLARIAKGSPDFEPGTMHRYSNTGYAVLGFVIEKLTGKSYIEVVKERITSRIGLNDTYVATAKMDPTKGEVFSYAYFPDGWKQERELHPSILGSAGAIISTPYDMVKFIHELFGGKLISAEHLVLMKTIREGEGMGMVPFEWEGKTFYGESGGGGVTGAWVAYLPEEKVAIAYTTNAKIYPVAEIMKGIAAIYYNRPFEIPAWDKVEVAPEILDKYVGVYSSPDAPKKWTITRDGGTLFVQPGSESAAALEATAQDKFQLFGGRVVFEFDAAKNQMILRRGGQSIVFMKEK